ncbi:MAG: hypothetical protein JO257_22035 [Deltaproteobacteria bacterium]|nr:hypothetical protein [Deltaproteobacteria bacterium]
MTLKTLISAAVLLGSSTAALAGPSWSASASAQWSWSSPQPVRTVRDHRWHRPAPAPTPAPAPMPSPWQMEQYHYATLDADDLRPYPAQPYSNLHTVATFDRAFDTRNQGPISINVGPYGIPSQKLILTSTGDSEVFNITVYYADGTSHLFNWNHLFNAPTSDGQAGSQLVMTGNGTAITRIVIDGYNSWNTHMAVMIQS